MINKKLLSFDRGALRFVGANVAFQWLGMLCNVIFVRAIARLVGAAFAGMLTTGVLWQNLLLCLGTVPFRFVFTLLASGMSDQASKNVKRTLRSNIYDKLTRLGPNYTETAATSEVVMLASEGVEQIDTYFAKYLPQLVYSLLAPVTLFVLLVGVHARSAIILLCCVPLIPMSIVAVQKFAKKLLAKYWGEYTTLGDSFLENIQGLTTLKIYDGPDGLRRGRAGHHQCGVRLCQGSAEPDGHVDHRAAGGRFLPAAAAAGQLFPHCHERCCLGRKNLQTAGSRGTRQWRTDRAGTGCPAAEARYLWVREGPHHSAGRVPDHPAGQLCLAGG